MVPQSLADTYSLFPTTCMLLIGESKSANDLAFTDFYYGSENYYELLK